MTQYASFNKTNLTILRAELQKVLEQYGPEGLEFSLGNIKFASQDCTVELKAKVRGGVTLEDNMLKTRMAALRLNPVSRMGDKLVEYKPRNYKMPFVYESRDGKRYKCAEDRAIALFGAV